MPPPTFATLTQFRELLRARDADIAITAFRHDGAPERWSCERLARASAAFASGLGSLGIARGERIILCAPNSPEWVAAYLGIVSSGAIAVPLDEQSSAETLGAISAHATARLIVTTRAHVEAFEAAATAGARPRLCLLDAPEREAASWRALLAADAPVPPEPGPDETASLLYTSGTTGAPKAVPLTHGNLAANASALTAAGFVSRADRVLLPLPLHHTYPFTAGLLMVLASGASLVMPASISGPEIAAAARHERATAMLAVPGLCAALWESIEAGVRARGVLFARLFAGLLGFAILVRRFTGLRIGRVLFGGAHARLGGRLRLLGCGGAKLPADLAWRLEGLGFRVLTGYGLTETSPVLTFNRPGKSRLGTEGQPLPGVEIEIAPHPGEPHGEILAHGPNVFTGYWNDAAATAEAFTPEGWFRTGDLGFIDSAGYLHIEGRSKEVIVLADGKNIFPEPLERIYAAVPFIAEIAILEHEGRLVALVVPDDEAIRAQGALRETALLGEALQDLSARLPSYQRITDFRATRNALPRTRLGKLRRHLLPELYGAILAGRAVVEDKPLTEADRALLASEPAASVWRWLEQRYPSRKLTLDTSPQLDLHIDSLAWVTITLELEQTLGVRLSGDAVSRILTLRDLLEEAGAAGAATPAARSPAAVYEPPGPLVRALAVPVYALGRLAMHLAYRIRTRGCEHLAHPGPLILAPNHASYLDPLALAAALPWRRLRNTYWAGWTGIMFTGHASRAASRFAQVFPVDPDRDLAAAIETALALLEAGHDVVWFPEGHRSPSGKLEAFQSGIAVLAERSGVPLVPVGLGGTFAAWPPGRRWPRPGRLAIGFGAPLDWEALGRRGAGENDTERVLDALRAEVARLLEGAGPTGG